MDSSSLLTYFQLNAANEAASKSCSVCAEKSKEIDDLEKLCATLTKSLSDEKSKIVELMNYITELEANLKVVANDASEQVIVSS